MMSLEEVRARFEAGETYLRRPVGRVTKAEASIARPITPDMPAHHAGQPKAWQVKEDDFVDHLLEATVWVLGGLAWLFREP